VLSDPMVLDDLGTTWGRVQILYGFVPTKSIK
jgi:hypothetical protein